MKSPRRAATASVPKAPVVPAAPAAQAAEVPPQDWPEDLLEVGYVLDAWGIRGWVKVAPDAAEPAALLAAPVWWLQGPRLRGAPPRRRLERRLARRHGPSVVALLDGVGDREGAELLKGWTILVRREDFPAPEGDEFYWADLIGCEVVDRAGTALGQVIGLLDSGAQSVLRLRRPQSADDTPERLIPFVDAYIVEVDLPGRRIVADWQSDYD